MNVEDIITLDNNKEYLILDKAEFDNNKYLYCVGISKDEKLTDEYVYLKEIEENNEFFIEEVNDEKILKNLNNLFTKSYLSDIIS